jgi:transposase-like protein
MPRAGPKRVHRYSLEFKLKAVKLSRLKGVAVQAFAEYFSGRARAATAASLPIGPGRTDNRKTSETSAR